jgi:hypothetical protein
VCRPRLSSSDGLHYAARMLGCKSCCRARALCVVMSFGGSGYKDSGLRRARDSGPIRRRALGRGVGECEEYVNLSFFSC